jgi:hypothetical protein
MTYIDIEGRENTLLRKKQSDNTVSTSTYPHDPGRPSYTLVLPPRYSPK